MKLLFRAITMAVLFGVLSSAAEAQSVHLADLIKMAKASQPDASTYVTTTLHFSLVNSGNVNAQMVSKFARSDGKTVESLIKTQSPGTDKKLHGIVDYSIRPKAGAEAIVKELEKARFKAARKIHDKIKDDRLYENAECTVSVYQFADKRFPAAIEVRMK